MNPLEPELVRGWLAKAEEDMQLIEAIAGEADRFLATIAFHAEQAAEKYLSFSGRKHDRAAAL